MAFTVAELLVEIGVDAKSAEKAAGGRRGCSPRGG